MPEFLKSLLVRKEIPEFLRGRRCLGFLKASARGKRYALRHFSLCPAVTTRL